MPRNASQAGKYSVDKFKRHERNVVKKLVKWTGNENFRRVPSSGGFNKQTTGSVKESLFAGDIICEDELKFCIECKSGAGFSMNAMIMNPDTNIFTKWWHQTIYDCTKLNKLPILFFKYDPNNDWVAFSKEGYDLFGSKPNCIHVDIYKEDKNILLPVKDKIAGEQKVELSLPNPYIFRWKYIEENFDPSLIYTEK